MYHNISLNASAFGLIRGFSQIRITGSGMMEWQNGASSGSIVVDIQNNGNITDDVSIIPIICQDSRGVTGGAVLTPAYTRSVAPDTTERYSFTTGTLHPSSPTVHIYILAYENQLILPDKTM